jgi:hypothetical protein
MKLVILQTIIAIITAIVIIILEKLGYQRWKQIKDAGRRWIAEIVFSSIKRVIGEDLFSRKFATQKAEAGLKVVLCNKFMSIWRQYHDPYPTSSIPSKLSYILDLAITGET